MLKIKNSLIVYRRLLLITLLFSVTTINGQTITPQVINSAGNNWQLGNGMTISDNIGEPFITTISNANNGITQGFLQNFVISNRFVVTVQNNPVSCRDKNDGNISIAISTNLSSFSTQYTWTPQSICPLNNCNVVDSLKPGTYTVSIQVTYTVGQTQMDTVFVRTVIIDDQNEPCKVIIYKGITANNDGVNDVFTIDNIADFPNNHLAIYNRWGLLVYDDHGYDNITKFWPKKEEISKLIGTTYFYVLNLGDGSNAIKGWVELIKD
ncbi:MAG: gliding motility-associated C-terminal domain-containing protein [Bacteroidia bacterium]